MHQRPMFPLSSIASSVAPAPSATQRAALRVEKHKQKTKTDSTGWTQCYLSSIAVRGKEERSCCFCCAWPRTSKARVYKLLAVQHELVYLFVSVQRRDAVEAAMWKKSNNVHPKRQRQPVVGGRRFLTDGRSVAADR